MEFSELDLRKAVHIREVLLLAVGKREADAASIEAAQKAMANIKSISSIAEYAEWLKTEDGLRLQVCAGGYGPETEDLREALLLVLLQRDLNSWAWASQVAYEALSRKWMTAQINERMIQARAEELCVLHGFRPPHWNKAIECEKCGIVPCPAEGEEKCFWCNTTTGRIYAESKKSGGEGTGGGEEQLGQVSTGTEHGEKDNLR